MKHPISSKKKEVMSKKFKKWREDFSFYVNFFAQKLISFKVKVSEPSLGYISQLNDMQKSEQIKL